MSNKFRDNLILLDEVDSTNLEAFKIGKRCAVSANHQTAGKGRLGRSFEEKPGESLLFTVLENEILDPRLTAFAAICVCKVLEENGLSCQIKWPNDILVNGKKICGILCEIKNSFCAIGIGINLFQKSFSDFGLEETATSAIQNGVTIKKEILLIKTLDKLDEMLEAFDKEIELKKESLYYKYYLKKNCLIGEEINFTDFVGNTKKAKVIDIDECYRLIIQMNTGKINSLDSGEITLHNK